MSSGAASDETTQQDGLSLAAVGHLAMGALCLGRGVATGAFGMLASSARSARQGATSEGAIGVAKGVARGLFNGVDGFAEDVTAGYTGFVKRSQAATDSNMRMRPCEQRYLCVREATVRVGLNRDSLIFRTLCPGEEVVSQKILFCNSGLPAIVQLADGHWVDVNLHPDHVWQCLAPMRDLTRDEGNFVVCDEKINIRQDWHFNSVVVRQAVLGTLLHGKRIIEYRTGFDWHTRVELDDGTWTSLKGANGESYLKTMDEGEKHMTLETRSQLARIWKVEKDIERIEWRRDCVRASGGLDAQFADEFQAQLQCKSMELAKIRLLCGSEYVERPSRVDSSGRCFLPNTMFKVSPFTCKTVEGIRAGDHVVSFYGEELEVASVVDHDEDVQTIIELKTRNDSLRVSSTHRIVVAPSHGPPSESVPTEKPAQDVQQGDIVFSSGHPQKVVKVSTHHIRTKLYEIRFVPDSPVETFVAPKWSLLTKGQPVSFDSTGFPDTDDGF